MEIDAVVVTYNRLDKLKKALSAYDHQSKTPHSVVVVDNHSNNDTITYLREWEKQPAAYIRKVIYLEKNIGGSGGFGTGIDYLLSQGAKWIWVADDDAYPMEDAFAKADEYLTAHSDDNISAITGCVMRDGEIDCSHRRHIIQKYMYLKEKEAGREEYNNDSFSVEVFTYVGTIMNAQALQKVGTTERKFFIYNDDMEHAVRLGRVGKILCVPAVKVIHDTPAPDPNGRYNWKDYYRFRNMLFLLKKNYPSRYYRFYKFLIFLRIFKQHNSHATKLLKTAVSDFENDRFGMSDIYRPGTNIYKV
jgi:rhamnopyranosyl-N-acetylglucosaminyl-diphospho-decaprenol beta-1,3/1,4-galactofuranosyltransferase